MSQLERWWSSERVMKRWNIDNVELVTLLDQGLPAFYREEANLHQIDKTFLTDFSPRYVEELFFNPTDIEIFEQGNTWLVSNYPDIDNTGLTAREKRELGMLRTEKNKWDSSIIAALHIGMYCSELDHPITHDELTDEVYKIDDKIPDTTIDKIWKAIPKELRKDAGRPKKRE